MAFNSLKALPRLPGGHASFSKSLFLSYILDWILIVYVYKIAKAIPRVWPGN
jgi:hypothetical protein